MLRSISRIPIHNLNYLNFRPSLTFVNNSNKIYKNLSAQKLNQAKNFSSTPGLNNGVISQTFETIVRYNSSFLQEIHHCGQSLPIDWEWYYTIILSTVLIRGAITLPIAIYNLKQVKKRKEMNHVLSAWNSSYSKRPYIEFNKPNHEDKSLFSILDETKSMVIRYDLLVVLLIEFF
jgi:membrane protein insertase Oxa1/YidC/SpoIIIJ